MTNIPPRRFRKARLHRSCKNTEAPDSCQDIDFRGCGIRGCGKGIMEFRRSVILSLLWRRISRDFSDLIAAGVALSPECRFFGQNAAQLQIRSTHSGRSFAQKTGSG